MCTTKKLTRHVNSSVTYVHILILYMTQKPDEKTMPFIETDTKNKIYSKY